MGLKDHKKCIKMVIQNHCPLIEDTGKVTEWALKIMRTVYGLKSLKESAQVSTINCMDPVIFKVFVEVGIFILIVTITLCTVLPFYGKRNKVRHNQTVVFTVENLV